MSELQIDDEIFIKLIKTIKRLIQKIEELITEYKKNNPADNLYKEWLDGFQVCQMLNIGKRTLQKYRTENTIPYSRLGGKIFYNIHDIEVLLDNNYQRTRKDNSPTSTENTIQIDNK